MNPVAGIDDRRLLQSFSLMINGENTSTTNRIPCRFVRTSIWPSSSRIPQPSKNMPASIGTQPPYMYRPPTKVSAVDV